jgi:predicted metal-dependent enzyme (double-stranded beta helix superfamily)
VATAPAFDVDDLLARCVEAAADTEPRTATRDVLARAVANARAVTRVLAPAEGGLDLLYNTSDLTIINIVWAPSMTLLPHDHRMWAAIAIYTGREDNMFFRRDPNEHTRIVETNAKTLEESDVVLLGDDVIHSVHNPLDRVTGAIHVYGGDFVREPRSQWGPGDPVERPYDLDFVIREFADANARVGLERRAAESRSDERNGGRESTTRSGPT